MHGADDEVASLTGADRHLDGFEVAQLADDDDVGVLAESSLERGTEGAGVGANLPLGYVATLREMHEFDRVFDGDDVVRAPLIEVVNHGRHRGGLAGTNGSRHEDQAIVKREELLERLEVRTEAELVEGLHFGGHEAVGPGRAFLVKHEIDAVAIGGAEREGEVVVLEVEVGLFLAFGKQDGVEPQGVFGGEALFAQEFELAVLAHEWAGIGREMKIAGAVAGAGFEQFADGLGEGVIVERPDGVEGESGKRSGGGPFVFIVVCERNRGGVGFKRIVGGGPWAALVMARSAAASSAMRSSTIASSMSFCAKSISSTESPSSALTFAACWEENRF